MSIKIGCFALVDPFSLLDHQLDRIRDWGFQYADVTDTGDGAVLGNHFGFSAVASLDANPFDLQRLFADRGLTITSYCAHSDLLDAGRALAVRHGRDHQGGALAAAIGVKHVITTEGEPVTPFGRGLSRQESVLLIAEKLHEPLASRRTTGSRSCSSRTARSAGRSTARQRSSSARTHRRSGSTWTPATAGWPAQTRSSTSTPSARRSSTSTGRTSAPSGRPSAERSTAAGCRPSPSAAV
jgi:hypothetical protein